MNGTKGDPLTMNSALKANEMFGLEGKVAFVTGGSGGIGSAICDTLADLGAKVYVTDLNGDAAGEVAAGIVDRGGSAESLTLDVTDAAACDAAVERIGAAGSGLQIFVGCVGWTDHHKVVDESPEYWRRVTDICYFGTIFPCVAAMRLMIEGGQGGRIINIGSEAGRLGNARQALYAGAKAGMVGFTKTLAREGARHNILANVVSPGVTETPLMRAIDPEDTAKMAKAAVLRRLAQPSEIAAAVAFFAAPASSFVTGEVLSASGGLSMVG